jgi:serpin B
MRPLLTLSLCLACACTGTRTGNPGAAPPGAVVAKSELARDESAKLDAAKTAKFGTDNLEFASAMYRELAKQPGNLFFSPYSISTALAMAYAGAKGNTESEMAAALHFTLPQSELHAAFNATDLELAKRKDQVIESNDVMTKGDGFQLRVVNQAWGQKDYTFLDSYLDVLAVNYGAGLFLLDFANASAARKTINDWVADQTAQRIKDLLPEDAITADTRLALTNAIYFKASWLREFQPSMTKPETFMAEGGARTVPMMHASFRTTFAEVQGYRAAALPYLTVQVKMIVVLPPAGSSLAEAAANFDATALGALLENQSDSIVTFSMPKWTFESEHSLKEPLKALGMRDAFEDSADFSGMDGEKGLVISDVFHKAFVAVDEKGTEAAAATTALFERVSAPPSNTLTLDRPFIFVIYDQPTGQVLFLGHVAEPS